jgi:Recombination endonuclease VII
MSTRRKRRTRAEIERAKRRALSARKAHLKKQHHMTLEEYDSIYQYQDGRCYTCRRANGRYKHLAVDHKHGICSWHPEDQSCRECWRGLICSTCNKFIGHCRDDVTMLYRFITYLNAPPAQVWRLENGNA